MKYANTVFWYLSPDGVDPYEPVPAADRDGYYSMPPFVVAGIKVLECERIGDVSHQDMSGFGDGKMAGQRADVVDGRAARRQAETRRARQIGRQVSRRTSR